VAPPRGRRPTTAPMPGLKRRCAPLDQHGGAGVHTSSTPPPSSAAGGRTWTTRATWTSPPPSRRCGLDDGGQGRPHVDATAAALAQSPDIALLRKDAAAARSRFFEETLLPRLLAFCGLPAASAAAAPGVQRRRPYPTTPGPPVVCVPDLR